MEAEDEGMLGAAADGGGGKDAALGAVGLAAAVSSLPLPLGPLGALLLFALGAFGTFAPLLPCRGLALSSW